MASFAALVVDIYSASALEKAIVICFLLTQEIIPLHRRKQ